MLKVLLGSTSHTGSINAILPVLIRLKEENRLKLSALAKSPSTKVLDTQGFPYQPIEQINPDKVSDSMQRYIPNIVLTGASVLEEADPGFKDGNDLERLVRLEARKLKLPSLAVLDAWTSYLDRFSDLDTDDNFGTLPDKIAIMDEFAKKEMIKAGFPEDKLVITGNPYLDNLNEKANRFTLHDRRNIKSNIGFSNDFLVFYAGKQRKDDLGFWDLDVINLTYHAIQELPNTGLVINLHPRTSTADRDRISQYVSTDPLKMKIEDEIGTHDLILASDLTLVSISNVANEAIFLGRPCISLQPNSTRQGKYLSLQEREKIIPVVYDSLPGIQYIQQASTSRKYRNELLQNASRFKPDGKATDRVVELIYDMIF